MGNTHSRKFNVVTEISESQAVTSVQSSLIYPHFSMNEIVSLAIQLTYHAVATFAT